ncbi:MAG TPA: response regulator [Pirellulales bacterium]|nr:response regulator [Pirellulales bacterium]
MDDSIPGLVMPRRNESLDGNSPAKRILMIVEDNPADADLVEELLQQAAPDAYQFVHAGKLALAEQKLQANHLDAVLLDLRLPDASGLASVRAIRDLASDVPVVVLTGTDDDEQLALSCIHAGAQDFLSKADLRPVALRRAIGYAITRTESQRAEYVLRETLTLQQAILDSADRSIISTTSNGVISVFNKAAERMLGYTADEMVGKNSLEAIHVPDELALQAREISMELGRTLDPTFEVLIIKPKFGQPEEREWTYVHKDGSRFPVLVSTTALRNSQGRISGYLCIANDITQRKRAEEELRSAKQTAELASRAKSDFLANMSHEIRTPMNGIIGMSELALAMPLNAEQRDAFETINECAESLLTVINDVLDFSKIEAGKLELATTTFDLPDKLRNFLHILALWARQKNLELDYQAAPTVPTWVVGDPDRLRQVIVNLVGNAIKFTEKGTVTLRVQLDESTEVNEQECLLHFLVTDTGIGIAPEKQQLIFNAFTQADGSMTRRFGGTGLGLTISARLVELMGGQIWVESQPNQGSVFHFTARFPIAQIGEEQSGSAAPLNLVGLPVLVVDDNPTSRRMLQSMLGNGQMSPLVASTVCEAVIVARNAAARNNPVRLILVDSLIHDMDGLVLIEKMRTQLSLVCPTIMMLSSDLNSEDVQRCQALGVSTYLRKPIHQADLWDAIHDALRQGSNSSESLPQFSHPSSTSCFDQQASEPESSSRNLQILLAEDNRINRKVAVRMLEDEGHRVTVAGTGQEALDAWEKQAFDLILMDLQMPDFDGLEVTKMIRNQERETAKHTPIIAMTAHAMKSDRDCCLAAGMDGYLSKPVHAQELRRVIYSVLTAEPVAVALCDWAAALEFTNGNQEFLREIASMLLEDAPPLLTSIRGAIDGQDAQLLAKLAHHLKGSLIPFAASAAIAQAARLEALGRSGGLTAAQDEYQQLDREISRLLEELRRQISEPCLT